MGARHAIGRVLPLVLTLTAAGCSWIDDLGAKDKAPLPGQRISVLALESQLKPDPRIADVDVRLPRPFQNPDWPQAGGYANHAMHHLALGERLSVLWRADIGSSSNSEERIAAPPVVADGRVYTMDSRARVSAFEVATGRQLWRADLTPEHEESGAIGGGIAYEAGRLYASTAYGELFALDPASGKQVWAERIGVPIRGAPTVNSGKVFAITFDNQVHAVDAETGKKAWSHSGITESAGLLGGASAAVDGGLVVVPYSSGELFALRVDNGTVAWNDQLVRTGRVSPVGTINDINGRPVIDRGRVFAVSHSGRMVSIDLRSGERIWDREIAGLQTPWVAGEFVFTVNLDAEVVCLSRRDGRIRWVRQLDRYRNPDSRTNKGLITWYGPTLAGDRLVLVSSHGQAVSLSPYSGEVLGVMKLSSSAAVAPVVADGALYILSDDATLLALK